MAIYRRQLHLESNRSSSETLSENGYHSHSSCSTNSPSISCRHSHSSGACTRGLDRTTLLSSRWQTGLLNPGIRASLGCSWWSCICPGGRASPIKAHWSKRCNLLRDIFCKCGGFWPRVVCIYTGKPAGAHSGYCSIKRAVNSSVTTENWLEFGLEAVENDSRGNWNWVRIRNERNAPKVLWS